VGIGTSGQFDGCPSGEVDNHPIRLVAFDIGYRRGGCFRCPSRQRGGRSLLEAVRSMEGLGARQRLHDDLREPLSIVSCKPPPPPRTSAKPKANIAIPPNGTNRASDGC
jgi:hypothetical protein